MLPSLPISRCASRGTSTFKASLVLSFRWSSSQHHSNSTSSSSSSERKPLYEGGDGEPVYKFSSYSGSERRKLSGRWENAFYGRIMYEPGMRERYASAVEEEEKMEREMQQEVEGFGRDRDHRYNRQQAAKTDDGDAKANQSNSNSSSSSGIPRDAEDLTEEDIRDGNFSEDEIKKYIIRTLTMAERRILYAKDYGGNQMMMYFSSGESKLNEAEGHLVAFGFMNQPLRLKIDELRVTLRQLKDEVDL